MKRFTVVALLALSLIAVLFWSMFASPGPKDEASSLIDPTSIGTVPPMTVGERVLLEEDIQTYAANEIAHGAIANYSVYFRDLMNGPVIALHENEDFAPASLLKLPIALWYYKHEDAFPGFLDSEILYTGPNGTGPVHYPPPRPLIPGTVYTLRELIDRMLADSDNDAAEVLIGYAGVNYGNGTEGGGRDVINQVYRDLDIKPVADYATYVIDVHTYIAFFRTLYTGIYLSHRSSAALLEHLSHSSFTRGLTAGLPSGIVAAHKFGERQLDTNGLVQLHDCGIVYAARPYLLCIMTQGKDYDVMAPFIAEVSKKVYSVMSEGGS